MGVLAIVIRTRRSYTILLTSPRPPPGATRHRRPGHMPRTWRRAPACSRWRVSVPAQEVRGDRAGDEDVDDQHPTGTVPGPLPHDVEVGEAGDAVAPGSERAAEGGEVDVVEEHALAVDAGRAVLVELGAVGGVVEDHDEAGLGLAQEGDEVGEPHRAAAVAGDEHRRAVGPGAGGAHGRRGAEADGLQRGADEDEL